MSDAVDDSGERRRALDCAQSFIVQAPAGSGKTGLLIQRYLALLSRVEAPEEIAALTFTRKAAAEMKKRVIEALRAARGDTPPQEAHARLTWELARAARDRDRSQGWNIEDNGARLRIQTIDALSASLTRQMPLLSRFGAQPESSDDATTLYREAARSTLALLESGDEVASDVARVLEHLDNNLADAETLISDMLRYRDQWLRNLGHAHQREVLEAVLSGIVKQALRQARDPIPRQRRDELVALAVYAAGNLVRDGADSPVCACAELAGLPRENESDLSAWLGIAELLLTKEGVWRKGTGLNKRFGFPATSNSKAEKAVLQHTKDRMIALLEALAENAALRDALAALRLLPAARYSDAQWEVLGAIVRLLPRATVELWNVFSRRGCCDFTEIAHAASRALGEDDAPTDLALALDYRIRHVLVDEFQDTSYSQFELLQKLTAGWQGGDDRTLFLVGDPMQSIYRFREAEVGLFLKAREEGIGSVPLEALHLTVNFRSQAGIVEWANATFACIMPAVEDIGAGAVRYVDSLARHAREPGAAAVWHAFADDSADDEAARVIGLVESQRGEDSNATVAILVRNRSHLNAIVPRLKAAGLTYRAIDIDPLGARQIVQDLLALTRAVLHEADRTAWLAILRAPWCGITLADLALLANDGGSATLWESINDETRLAALSQDGRQRIARVREVLRDVIRQRRRGGLREAVEGAWLALGGPACLAHDGDLDDAARYLDYLEEHESAASLDSLADFSAGLEKLFAAADPHAGETLQIMTLHKAKGLEFDVVIVPGLGRAPRHDAPQLMKWIERPRAGAEGHELLIAPIREAGTNSDAIYDFIARLERDKQRLEDERLMYVAATRARKRLHLLGSVKRNEDDAVSPPKAGTLLAALWPAVEEAFLSALDTPASVSAASTASSVPSSDVQEQTLRRLPGDWIAPPLPASVLIATTEKPAAIERAEPEFSWASETARHTGTLVHRYLQVIAEEGLPNWNETRVMALGARLAGELAQLGIPREEQGDAVARAQRALVAALADERGRWVLDAHIDAQSELRLTGVANGTLRNVSLDRTFIDAGGTRWIIDFKTSAHEGGERERFLDNEQERYRAQLEDYAELFGKIAPEPIRLGLYFPLLGGWREWTYAA